MIFNIDQSLAEIHDQIILKIELYGPKVIGALVIIIIGAIIARIIYLLLMYFFKKIKLNALVDKLKIELDEENTPQWARYKFVRGKTPPFTSKFKVDSIVSQSAWVFVFLVFFRLAISFIGIREVEGFLSDLLYYLPSLFVGIVIGFFGIRFANFVYDVTYHTLRVTKEQNSKIIATSARIIVLFFTLMVVLDYTKIVSDFIINTILIGFIAMIALAW